MSDQKYTATEAIAIAIGAPFVLVAVILSSVPGMLYSGWVEMKLWNWFVAPYFHINPISFWVMLGISAFIASHGYQDHTRDRKIAWVSVYVSQFTTSSLLLLIGYLVHHHLSN